jgi:prepilin-type processing-associated H-X9-DG protein
VAAANHEFTFKYLPTGGYVTPAIKAPNNSYRYTPLSQILGGAVPATAGTSPQTGKEQQWGWAYQLLPFLEQDNLFNTPQSSANSGDVFVSSQLVKFYACPSRRAATLSNSAFVGDYAGNAGVTGNAPGTSNPMVTNLNGTIVMYPLSSQVSLGRMRNGASNTILVAEKSVSVPSALAGGEWGDSEGTYTGFKGDSVRFGDFQPVQDPPTPYTKSTTNTITLQSGTTALGQTGWLPFGSAHAGGMNAVFGDGSVRTITYGIPLATFQAITNRANTTAVDLSDL